jgi:hypothetical protein
MKDVTDLDILFKRLRHVFLTEPQRSRRYLQWVKTIPCVLCVENHLTPAEGTTDPHHLFGSVHGLKSSDLTVVPLCREHHQEAEAHPERHRMTLLQALVVCLHEFARANTAGFLGDPTDGSPI